MNILYLGETVVLYDYVTLLMSGESLMNYLLYGSFMGVVLSLLVFLGVVSFTSTEAALLVLLILSVLLCLPLIIKALMKNQVPRPGLFGSRAPGPLTTVETKKDYTPLKKTLFSAGAGIGMLVVFLVSALLTM